MKPALHTWPLWAAALGIWLPLDYNFAVSGYLFYASGFQAACIFASAWLLNALIIGALCLLLVLSGRLMCRCLPGQSGQRLFDIGILALARTIGGVVLLHTGRLWLDNDAAPGLTHSMLSWGHEWGALILLASMLIGTKLAQPGPILILARRVSIAGGALALLLIPAELFLNWKDRRSADPAATVFSSDAPDVILITVDSLAAGHMSLYGYHLPTTPRLDQLAETAVVYDRFYASSNFTTPSIASLMLGVRPWTHRVFQWEGRAKQDLHRENMLADFGRAGYQVIAVNSNPAATAAHQGLLPWVNTARNYYTDQTFGPLYHAQNWLDSLLAGCKLGLTMPSMALVIRLRTWLTGAAEARVDDAGHTLQLAARLWQRPTSRPRFMWVHLFPPHDPYAAPAPFLGMFDNSQNRRHFRDSSPAYNFLSKKDPSFPGSFVGRYDESIRYVDDRIGKFLDLLRTRAEFNSTLIVLSADHGESFSRQYGGHGGPLLSEELVRIPLLIKSAHQESGRRNTVPGELIDLRATLLDLAGLPEPARGNEGLSLIDAEARRIGRAIYSMNFQKNGQRRALTRGSIARIEERWKYVHYQPALELSETSGLQDELFDILADPSEQHNLIRLHPEIAAQMKAAIDAELEQRGQALQ